MTGLFQSLRRLEGPLAAHSQSRSHRSQAYRREELNQIVASALGARNQLGMFLRFSLLSPSIIIFSLLVTSRQSFTSAARSIRPRSQSFKGVLARISTFATW